MESERKRKKKRRRRDDSSPQQQTRGIHEKDNEKDDWNQRLFDEMGRDEPDMAYYDASAWQETPMPSYFEWTEQIRIEMEKKMRGREKKERDERDNRERSKRKRQREREREELALRKKEDNQKLVLGFWKRFDAFRETAMGRKGLGLRDFPWPLLEWKDLETDLTLHNVEQLLSANQNRERGGIKALAKEQLLVWHPDKFMRFKEATRDSEWDGILLMAQQVSKILTQINQQATE